jgi:hypothetical protein
MPIYQVFPKLLQFSHLFPPYAKPFPLFLTLCSTYPLLPYYSQNLSPFAALMPRLSSFAPLMPNLSTFALLMPQFSNFAPLMQTYPPLPPLCHPSQLFS